MRKLNFDNKFCWKFYCKQKKSLKLISAVVKNCIKFSHHITAIVRTFLIKLTPQ